MLSQEKFIIDDRDGIVIFFQSDQLQQNTTIIRLTTFTISSKDIKNKNIEPDRT